jgi:hypothetical protein
VVVAGSDIIRACAQSHLSVVGERRLPRRPLPNNWQLKKRRRSSTS